MCLMKDKNGKNNVYLRIDKTYNLNEFLDKCILKTNIVQKKKNKPIDYTTTTWSYIEAYKKEIQRKNKNYKKDANGNIKKNIEAITITTQLPKGLTKLKKDRKYLEDFIEFLVDEIKQGNKFKYFATLEKKGKATFIKVVILEREWFPEGKKVKLLRTNTVYINKKGHAVKHDTVTDEKLKKGEIKLKYKKGDIFYKKITLTDKIRFLGINTYPKGEDGKVLFLNTIERIKNKIMNYFHQKFYCKLYETEVFFKKISYKKKINIKNSWFYSDYTLNQHDKYYYLKKRRIKAINEIYEAFNHYIARPNKNQENCLLLHKEVKKTVQENSKKMKLNELEKFSNNLIEKIKNGTLEKEINIEVDIYKLATKIFPTSLVKKI